MVDAQVQTMEKPPLQLYSEETDLYNCFDGIFNGKNLSYKEVVQQNVGLASKRHLN